MAIPWGLQYLITESMLWAFKTYFARNVLLKSDKSPYKSLDMDTQLMDYDGED